MCIHTHLMTILGALGFVPRFFDFLYPVCLIRVCETDPELPYINPHTGRCELALPHEKGLLVGVINNNRVDRRFDGYTDVKSNQKKILSGVFKNGDTYFNTGDLLTRDEYGWFFWSDRTGDTFRW
jgi:fatty-acyl-CoA synthase